MKKIFRSEKRISALLLMLLLLPGLLLSSGIRAHADVIYEPDDDFYQKHASDCTYVDAVYIVNHPKGKATMYVSPEDAKVVSEFENGERIRVNYSYTDRKGIEWASVTDWRSTRKDGWIPMDYLYEAYSDRLFYADYASEIRPAAQGEHADSDAMTVYFFDYPGSDQYFLVYLDDMDGEPVSALPATMIFTDEEGRNWGRIGYFYGYKDRWFCMDDPEKTAEELYPDGLPVRDTRDLPGIGATPEIGPDDPEKQETGSNEPGTTEPEPIEIRPTVNVAVVLIAAALISLAVAAAVVILIIIVKHTKKKK